MKPNLILKAAVGLTLLWNTNLQADGIVAETRGGKVFKLEWDGYGTEFQQVLARGVLIVQSKDGKELLEATFSKDEITSYSAVKNEDGSAEIKLVIEGESLKINLSFNGKLQSIPDDSESEIDSLVDILRDPKRKMVEGSLLTIECSIGKFEFRDVLFGMYGDL